MQLTSSQKIEELGIDGLKIIQDYDLYRFTSDSVILSRFASFRKNEKVADFCSGSGIVGLHYYALHQNLSSVTFFEIQKQLADINGKSIELNNLQDKMTVENCRLQDIRSEYNGYFSLILCNPPYKKKNSGEVNLAPHIAMCRHETEITQEEIVEIASKKLRHGGRFAICQRIERFTDLICSLKNNGLNPSKIQFVATGDNSRIYLALIEAVKNTAPQLKILPTIENKGK